MMLEIIDTAGMEHFPSIQEESIRQAQGFLLVFSISALANLQELHDQIVGLKRDPAVPMVLVGNKV